ncbi:3525_t:CDS:2, partial [Rhizophagus irregularis]
GYADLSIIIDGVLEEIVQALGDSSIFEGLCNPQGEHFELSLEIFLLLVE